MNYLFDTDSVCLLYNTASKNHEAILGRLTSSSDADSFLISGLTLFELEYSLSMAPESKKTEIRNIIIDTKEDFLVVSLKNEVAGIYGQLKAEMKRQKKVKPENMKKHNIDSMIASSAILEGCILVSSDSVYKEIQFVNPDFRHENWTV